jgi:siroheme synthase-like protein
MASKYLPINLSLKDRTVLVIGGGNVALRKVETLLDYHADITVIAPEPDEKIEYFGSKGSLKLEKRSYQSPEASSYGMVISASDDEMVNRRVYDDCAAAGVLVNIVDNPKSCTFTFPATLRRDCLSVAVSTDGKAPFLSAHLRQILEGIFPKRWDKIARMAADYRRMVQSHWGDDLEQKTAALDRFIATDWKTLIKEKDEDALRVELERIIQTPEPSSEEVPE